MGACLNMGIFGVLQRANSNMQTQEKRFWKRMMPIIGNILKVGVSIGALVYIIHRLYQEDTEHWAEIWALEGEQLLWIGGAILLFPLNMLLEARKWQQMVKLHYPNVGILTATQAVLAGFTAGIFTPNRLGEYAGRVWYLRSGKRAEAVVLTFIDRICQMVATLLGGTWGLWYVLRHHEGIRGVIQDNWGVAIDDWMYVLWGLNGLLLMGILLAPTISRQYIPEQTTYWLLQKIRTAYQGVGVRLLLRIMVLSFIRYAVFSTQYWMMMVAFGLDKPAILAFALIGLIFLIKSILPSLAFSELGIRESTALFVTGLFGISAITAFGSAFVLYLINIITPSLLGLIFIQRLKV